jgi:hypothetical protein
MPSTCRIAKLLYCGAGVLVVVLILSSGCTSTVPPPPVTGPPTESLTDGDRSWMEVPLTDLQGKGNFSIRSFAGKSVLLMVVSDACPACISQLSREIGEIERLPGVQDKSIAVIVLDIDPAVDPGFIAKHYHDQPDFSGYTAHSSEDLTLELLRELGPFAIDTEVIPVILICPDGRGVLLPPGFKSTDTLDTLHTKEC